MKTYPNHPMTDTEAKQALADACKQVETNLPLYTYQCQNHSSVNDTNPAENFCRHGAPWMTPATTAISLTAC